MLTASVRARPRHGELADDPESPPTGSSRAAIVARIGRCSRAPDPAPFSSAWCSRTGSRTSRSPSSASGLASWPVARELAPRDRLQNTPPNLAACRVAGGSCRTALSGTLPWPRRPGAGGQARELAGDVTTWADRPINVSTSRLSSSASSRSGSPGAGSGPIADGRQAIRPAPGSDRAPPAYLPPWSDGRTRARRSARGPCVDLRRGSGSRNWPQLCGGTRRCRGSIRRDVGGPACRRAVRRLLGQAGFSLGSPELPAQPKPSLVSQRFWVLCGGMRPGMTRKGKPSAPRS